MKNIIVLAGVSLLLTVCCGRKSHDPRLEQIWKYVSDEPRKAMVALDSIDASNLSESDRTFYNLTSIKAKDKAYVLHKSDSLILTVIDYYSHHKEENLYAEALYYGGRVYYDLGDYPTSLGYFQKALDLLPENTANMMLRGNVLSQTGGLLNDLGLHKQAIPYIESALKVDHQLNDTLNLALDYKTLGNIYLNIKDYDAALRYFVSAERLAVHVSKENMIEDKIHQAAAFYYKDDINNALKLIRVSIGMTDSLAMNYALSFASKIYLKANILDTAYMYARQLTLSSNPDKYFGKINEHIRHI